MKEQIFENVKKASACMEGMPYTAVCQLLELAGFEPFDHNEEIARTTDAVLETFCCDSKNKGYVIGLTFVRGLHDSTCTQFITTEVEKVSI